VRKALEAKKKAVDEAEAAKQRKPDENLTLRIEITGLDGNADDIKKLADMLQKSLPKNSKVLILGSRPGAQKGPEFEFRKDGEGWRFWKFKGDEKPKTVEVPKPKTGQYPTPVPTPPADKRIDGLEKKLEAIMKELEALRKEMKSRPGSRGFGFGGTAPRPADDDPKPK
jgi:hypothetical protein